MIHFNYLIITINILCISAVTKSSRSIDLLPQSIIELKQYYNVINNLEKRGVLNKDIASAEKRLCIEHASKLAGVKELFTEEEFINWKRRQLVISFANIIAVLAGVIVMISLTILIGIYIIPLIASLPSTIWETLFYLISFYLMIFVHNSWVIFFGCLGFLATLAFSIKSHFRTNKYSGLVASWMCFFAWTFVAIYQQHREAGYLAIMALESAFGFVVFVGELVIMIGFQNEKIIPSGTIASFILILIGIILHVQRRSNILTTPFTEPLLFLGTFVYFIGLLILSSRLYTRQNEGQFKTWFLQFITFFSGLAAMFFGPMFEIPFIQAIGGTMFVIWLLEKYIEIVPWKTKLKVVLSLWGYGLLLYGCAYFLKTYPQYFIFHSYSL